MLEIGRRTVTLEVHTPRGDAALFFQEGRMVHATYLTVFGARAFYHLFAEPVGHFQLHDGCAALEHTVNDSVTGLVLEAARLLDTARRDAPTPIAPLPPGPRPRAAAVHRSPAEQRDRMQSMRRVVSEFNVYRWAGRMLIDAAELRRRDRVTGRLASTKLAGGMVGR